MPDSTLHVDDDDRYGRLRLIPWWDQQRLRHACALVVGAGALGNEVLKNLALVGVGHLIVVDFDVVEPANLARSVLFRARDRGRLKAEVAAEAVRELNPDLHVTAIPGNVLTAVGLGIFRDADVVVGCLDNREARLWVNRACWKVSTPWVDGGIQELNGVVKVFTPPDSPCYECGMTENDYRLINLRYSCPLLRQEDLAAGRVPTVPTIASLIGGLQAQEALKLIHGIPVAGGEAFVFNGVVSQSYRTQFQRREDCLSHETYTPPVELPLQAHRHTAADLFAEARRHLGAPGPAIVAGSRPGRFPGVPAVRHARAGFSAVGAGRDPPGGLPAVRRTVTARDRACRGSEFGTCQPVADVAGDSPLRYRARRKPRDGRRVPAGGRSEGKFFPWPTKLNLAKSNRRGIRSGCVRIATSSTLSCRAGPRRRTICRSSSIWMRYGTWRPMRCPTPASSWAACCWAGSTRTRNTSLSS